MTSIRGRGRFTQRGQAFEAFTRLLSNMSDNRDYVDLLRSNKLGLSKVLIGSEIFARPKVLAGSP